MSLKWHRFPINIPSIPDRVLVTVKNYDGSVQVTFLRYVGPAGMSAFQYFTESGVIAWAEIEPFEPKVNK